MSKIAFVVDSLHSITGGTERQLYVLITGLIKQGKDVELFVLRHSSFTSNLEGFPCKVSELAVSKIVSFKTLVKMFKFKKYLINNGFEIVHVYFNDSAILVPIYCNHPSLAIITSRRDMGFWYTKNKLRLLKLANYFVKYVVSNSKAVNEHTIKTEKLPRVKSQVIYNGQSNTTLIADEELEFPSKNIYKIVVVANVRKIKNFEDLILAIYELKKDGINVCCTVLGNILEEDYYQHLQRLIKKHELELIFDFKGAIKEPRRYLNNFDIGVLTSHSEGFSNTIMEYLAAGLPVVCSNVGGNPELVKDNENGFLYPVGNAKQLANCLYKILHNVELKKTLSLNAKKGVCSFSDHNMISEHIKLYDSVRVSV